MNKTSLSKLATCDDRLIRLANAVDEEFPIQCICGSRGKAEQDMAFKNKTSKLKWPNSAHNKTPSMAGDFVPDPDNNPATLDWNDIEAFKKMRDVFEKKAKELGIKIKPLIYLGKKPDYAHVELV